MKLGISSWTYPWSIGVAGYDRPIEPMDEVGLVKQAAALGVDVVQIADNLPLHTMDEARILRLKAAVEAYGIELELGTRGVQPDHLRTYLGLAKMFGSKLVRTLTHTQDSTPGLDQVKVWLSEVLPEYEEAGVTLGLENYERHTSGELAGLIRSLGTNRLGVCLDTVNSLGALEMPVQIMDELGPFVVNLHIKDFSIRRVDYAMGYIVTGCPAGQGRLDAEWVIGAIRSHGREPNVILEQWPPYTGSVESSIAQERDWAIRSVAYLKTVVI